MKPSKKIQILSSEEVKKYGIGVPASGDSSDDSGAGNKELKLDCPGSGFVSCEGVSAKPNYAYINGFPIAESLTCTQADGKKVNSGKCDLKILSSGVGSTMFQACSGKKPNELCFWYDTELHTGKCRHEGDNLHGTILCDETLWP